MTDKQLLILIRAQIIAGLARRGDTTTKVIANFQPRHQGRENGPVLYLYMLDEHRYGWQSRKQVYDADNDRTTITEEQIVETPIQVTAFLPQNPEETTGLTAKDLASNAAFVINSLLFARALKAQNIGVQRITDVRNPYFENDRGQYEASPSFDFTVSHKRTMVETDNAVDAFEDRKTRV